MPARVVLAYGRNTPYFYEPHTPLSLFALGAYLETQGVEVEYYDERIHPLSRFDALLEDEPALVGFSVIGGYQIESSRALAARARRLSPRTLVVWGGLFASTRPVEVLREGAADAVVVGEGEETLLELARRLADGRRDLAGIAGLARLDGGRLVEGPRRAPPDVESLPFPYHAKALPLLRRYLEFPAAREAVGYEASRGCRFACAFCYSPGFHGRARVKSQAKVRRELAALRELGVGSLDVYDDVLVDGREADVAALADALRELGMSWVANLRVEMISDALLRRLEASNCRWLYFGLESDDDEALRALRKGFSASQLRRGLALLGEPRAGAGERRLGAVLSVMAGLPPPAPEGGLERALDLAEELHRAHPRAEIQVQSFVPLPGTPLYEAALAGGFVPPRDLSGWARHDHFSVRLPWLKDPDLPRRAYLTSFLAYRGGRHLSRPPLSWAAAPLRRVSLWRLRRRFFGLYAEGALYSAYLAFSRARLALARRGR